VTVIVPAYFGTPAILASALLAKISGECHWLQAPVGLPSGFVDA